MKLFDNRVKIIRGRYAGSTLNVSSKTGVYSINRMELNSQNVKALKILKNKPMTFYMMMGYLCRIIWRDNTYSDFVVDEILYEHIKYSLLTHH